jgi:cytochrome c oxidase subunit IV
MEIFTRAAIVLRALIDDLRDRREQGDQTVTWVLIIIAGILIAGVIYAAFSGFIAERIAEFNDPF